MYKDSLFQRFSNDQTSDFLLRIATPSLQIRITSRHILEPALPKHLHRGRSSRHPCLASRLVRNGITMLRKICSEASLLEVWVNHCSLSICPNILETGLRRDWIDGFLTIIGLGVISVLARKAQTLNEYRKHFHVHALDFWRQVM